MHGTAKHTSGGLSKSDLKYNKAGVIVSKTKSEKAKRKAPVQIKLWRDAVKEYHKRIPGRIVMVKKGTTAYKIVKTIYKAKLARL
jgi:hypothetical protein